MFLHLRTHKAAALGFIVFAVVLQVRTPIDFTFEKQNHLTLRTEKLHYTENTHTHCVKYQIEPLSHSHNTYHAYKRWSNIDIKLGMF